MKTIRLSKKELRVLIQHLGADLSYGYGGTFTPIDENSKRDIKKADREFEIAEGILKKLKE